MAEANLHSGSWEKEAVEKWTTRPKGFGLANLQKAKFTATKIHYTRYIEEIETMKEYAVYGHIDADCDLVCNSTGDEEHYHGWFHFGVNIPPLMLEIQPTKITSKNIFSLFYENVAGKTDDPSKGAYRLIKTKMSCASQYDADFLEALALFKLRNSCNGFLDMLFMYSKNDEYMLNDPIEKHSCM